MKRRPRCHAVGALPEIQERIPTRGQLADCTTAVLRCGQRKKADVFIVDIGQDLVVVKDYSKKQGWPRFWGRVAMRWETCTFRKLGSRPYLPRFIGRIDSYAIAVELIEAEHLAFSARRSYEGGRLLSAVRGIISDLEENGVYDLDLGGRRNLLVGPCGKVWLIDLGASLCLRPGGWLHRLLGRPLSSIHHFAYLKWKRLLTPTQVGVEDRSYLAAHRWLRHLWLLKAPGAHWHRP